MKLNELKTKIKNSVKKHWKKGLVIITGSGTLLYIGYKMVSRDKINDLEKPKTDLGDIIDLWIEKDHGEDTLNAIVRNVNVNDLGWLAGDIIDKSSDRHPELKGMTQMDAVLTWWKPKEEMKKVTTIVVEDSLEKTLDTISKLEKAKKEA